METARKAATPPATNRAEDTMGDDDRERHELLRDLRDATRAAREASAELSRRVKDAEKWDLGYRCFHCKKRERVSGALCLQCAVMIQGAVTKDMIEREKPGARVRLTDCMAAVQELLTQDKAEAFVSDESNGMEYCITVPGSIWSTWHAGDNGRL